ncbi:MFS transporter [Trinickia caryophylli]|uniref:MFS transporter, MHS family, proline/betaine transporter n=1 Tax=Trinickia caryophylli TaxID=28094 RepID=A0A1X7G577_TRICW|nr:MFS transporter [Trinickia caryophylli]TRX15381.1 MFS transporter [Trinickia caryophylli]SMF64136.1 MFS transporter, MHS family, proline/betaine transporter [Trinickia caryophylli]
MSQSRSPYFGDAASTAASGPRSNFALIASVTLGNGLEMFDFMLFSFFQVIIGKQFFPSATPLASLLMATATFGAGYLMRPLGAIVMGAYADRAGRKPAMLVTIALMGAGTAFIGLAPTYAQIGMLAPVLVVLGRLLQGFSTGGEIGASTALLAEAAPRRVRGFMISWQMASQGGAALMGALTGFMLSTFLSSEDLEAWGWRLPFLLGLLLGPVGYAIRRTLHETRPLEPAPGGTVLPIFTTFRQSLLCGILLMVGGTASMYIVVFYMPTYLVVALHMPASTSFLASCAAGAVLIIGSPLAGRLSDRLTRRKPFVAAARLLGAALIYPVFWLLNHTTHEAVALAAISALAGCLALGSGACFQLLVESFPRHFRCTGFSTIYSVGVSIFGGFAPFVVTWLIGETGDPMAPAHYMAACSLISLAALVWIREPSPIDPVVRSLGHTKAEV